VDGGYGGVAWSPDSKTIYFTVRVGLGSDVLAWNIDGKTSTRNMTANINPLLGRPGKERWVSDVDVSHDGQWMAMVYSDGDRDDPANKRKNRIALVKVDGTEARLVTDGGPLAPGMYGAWAAGDFDPDFSPDGKAISFQRATDVKYLPKRGVYTSDLMRQNLDGTGLTLLSPKNNQLQAGISSWGGPRCQVVWAVWSDDEPAHLETANPDGTDRREIRFKGDASHVQWIPVDNAVKACK
jgi:Tol biopolymer transport system component